MDTKLLNLLQSLSDLGDVARDYLKQVNRLEDPLLVQDNSLINHTTSKASQVYPDEERSWTASPFNAMLMSAEAHCIYRTVKALGPGNYADLGVMHGGSTAIMGHALSYIKAAGHIYAVDLFGEAVNGRPIGSAAAMENLDEYFRKFSPAVRLHLCQGTTAYWASKVNCQFNFVFIDADHSYEACKEDFEKWSPKVILGGYIAFHDTHFRSVDKFLKEIGPEWRLVEHIFRLKLYQNLGNEVKAI